MKTFFKIAFVFLIWRVGLFLIGNFADVFLVYAPTFPYADGLLNTFNVPRWLYSWANFDGVHYLTIMQKGYHGADLVQAFFPIYPYITKFANYLIDNYLLTSLLVSNISFLCLLYVWYQFIKQNYSQKIAVWATATLLFFPTSFFFVATYTESLFLLFVLGAFWTVKQKKYWLTAVCIALASATRVIGILLLPAILFEIVFFEIQWGSNLTKIKKIIKKKLLDWTRFLKPITIVLIGSIGIFIYMYYLYKQFGDPLYFFHVQSEFGGGIRQETIILYPQVVWRYIKILLTARPFDFKYFSYVQEFVVSTTGLILLLYSVTKTRLSYIIFSLLAFLLPTLTGTFSSMPRYILVCFPLFILLSVWLEKSKIFRYTWFTMNGILLLLNTVLYIQGYWVA